jgi:putative Mn2+ efflux pump MntP
MALLPPEKSVPWLAGVIASYAGWYLGALISTFIAFIAMIVGGGLGLFLGKRWVREHL